jgi:hypothetical protein
MGPTDGRRANPLAELTEYELRHPIGHLAEHEVAADEVRERADEQRRWVDTAIGAP